MYLLLLNQMRDIIGNNGGGGDNLALNSRTHYHAELGYPDKCRVIQGFVVYNSLDFRALSTDKINFL